MLDPALRCALARVARLMGDARYPWWVIGSAAVALHGVDTDVDDIDVLLTIPDARRIDDRLDLGLAPGRDNGRFRSALYGEWRAGRRMVEFMADLHLRERGQYELILPASRVGHEVEGHMVYTPDRAELIDILTRFGREKDIVRAALLRRSGPFAA